MAGELTTRRAPPDDVLERLAHFQQAYTWDESIEVIRRATEAGLTPAGVPSLESLLSPDGDPKLKARAAIQAIGALSSVVTQGGELALGYLSYACLVLQGDVGRERTLRALLGQLGDPDTVAAVVGVGVRSKSEGELIVERLSGRWGAHWFSVFREKGLVEVAQPLSLGRRILVELSKQACQNVSLYTAVGQLKQRILARLDPGLRRKHRISGSYSPWLTYGDVAHFNRKNDWKLPLPATPAAEAPEDSDEVTTESSTDDSSDDEPRGVKRKATSIPAAGRVAPAVRAGAAATPTEGAVADAATDAVAADTVATETAAMDTAATDTAATDTVVTDTAATDTADTGTVATEAAGADTAAAAAEHTADTASSEAASTAPTARATIAFDMRPEYRRLERRVERIDRAKQDIVSGRRQLCTTCACHVQEWGLFEDEGSDGQ